MAQESKTKASDIALGGVLAALAVGIQCVVGLIPVATFVTPMLCILTGQLVQLRCGRRIAWAWYGAVAILGLLLAPDKEAALVYAALGYYPILKPWLEKGKLSWLWKGLYFNGVILLLYGQLMRLLGFAEILQELQSMGIVMTVVTLLLGNLVFFLLDRLLSMKFRKRR